MHYDCLNEFVYGVYCAKVLSVNSKEIYAGNLVSSQTRMLSAPILANL